MTDFDNKSDPVGRQPSGRDQLDHELDAALAKYATAEPRTGLEERILATLRAEREHAVAKAWWRWPALGVTAAAVIVVALFLVWRSGKPAHDITAHQPAVRADKQTETHIAANDAVNPVRPAEPAVTTTPVRRSIHRPQVAVASEPRLDHFPSPRPLSDEEKLLVRYVQDFPQEAVMIAKAQADFEREMENPSGDQPPGTNSVQPDQQER
jgi:hypothetical protein